MMLVCFALGEEARPFRRLAGGRGGLRILVTGMGRRNADAALRSILTEARPEWVLTCGFAGGLRADLRHGAVLYEADEDFPLTRRLQTAGAAIGRFHCSDRMLISRAEKERARAETGADAVEMESGVIRLICRAAGIPSVTVRVVSDTANEDLPLDFNRVLTADQRIGVWRLAWRIVRQPALIGSLRQLQRRTRDAAEQLAEVLARATDV